MRGRNFIAVRAKIIIIAFGKLVKLSVRHERREVELQLVLVVVRDILKLSVILELILSIFCVKFSISWSLNV